jgi:GH24 family phage-related lysozyme (muramidase)/peptidoglycan hydrolase-like protein with peptidoglycan-binding domain
MTYALTWLPTVLEKAGLKVAEVPGWRTRGRREMGAVRGVICHHTATMQLGNMPTLQMLVDGRCDLAGPLCHLGLGRDGTFYVVAAGLANHAGKGSWEGITDRGNTNFIGIEAENSGHGDDPWPEVQMEAYQRGVAAILAHVGAQSNMCCGHKEYAPTRKPDPNFDMPLFRTAVQSFMLGKTPSPLIAACDAKRRPTLRRGARGGAVERLQRLIGVDPDGIFGALTEAALREVQRQVCLVPDGICGPKSWAVLSGDQPLPAPAPGTSLHGQPGDGSARMKVGDAGLELIRSFESCEDLQADGRFKAYPDPGSSDGLPWTIGWGSTGDDIDQNSVWTQEQCDARFAADMAVYAEQVVSAIGDAPTTQNQFDALVSFHYNTGAIRTATLTRRHNAKDYAGAREAFGWWIKNDGKVMRGLVRRRKAEGDLYAAP